MVPTAARSIGTRRLGAMLLGAALIGSLFVPPIALAARPTVTINQAVYQADPTGASSIHFTVVFSESVTGFISDYVIIDGTAGGTKTAIVSGGPQIYTVAIFGMTTGGSVIARLAAGAGTNPSNETSVAATSTDNLVQWLPGGPYVSTPDLDPASDTGVSSTDNATADGTPTFSGTGDPGSIELLAYNPDIGLELAVGRANVDGSGRWSITTSLVLSPRTYYFTATRWGSQPLIRSLSLEVTIGAVPPAPSMPDLLATSDTGPSSTDNITSDTTPTFTVTATPNITLDLYAGTTYLGSIPSNASGTSGPVTINNSVLAGLPITAKATNVFGTSVASPALTVTIWPSLGVTINQASGQVDPTGTSPINYTVTFSNPVANFTSADVSISGTTGGTKTATVTGGPTTYNVAINGMTTAGTVIASVGAGLASDAAGNLNTGSTTTDDTVTWSPSAPAAITLTTSAPIPPGAKDPVILWGQGFTLGVQFGAGGANRTVELQGTRDGAAWTTITTLTSDANGRAAFYYRPVTNLFYRAVFAGAPDLAAATSNQVRTVVRQLAVLRPTNSGSTRSISRTTSITFTTTVRPARPELPPSTVSFFFYHQVAGIWQLATRRDVVATSTGLATTTFTFSTAGQWYVRSQAGPTPYNANSVLTPIDRYSVG